MKGKIVYRDVTHEPDAESRANHAPEMRTALVDCGFRRVGILEAHVADWKFREAMRFYSGPDADLMNEIMERGDVCEIFASPDQKAFAGLERYYGGPVVCLQTILEDGVVVETTMKPRRSPNYGIPGFAGSDNLIMRLTAKSLRFVMGPVSSWPHENWPRSGYYVELVDTGEVDELWGRHQWQVKAVAHKGGASIRPHNSISLDLAISHRAHGVMEFNARRQATVRFRAVFSAMFLALFLPLVFLVVHFLSGDAIPPFFKGFVEDYPLVLLGCVFAGPLSVLAMVILAPRLMIGLVQSTIWTRSPGLELQPVPDLLDEVPWMLTMTPPSSPASPDGRSQSRAVVDKKRAMWHTRVNLILAGAFTGLIVSPSERMDVTDLSVIWGIGLIGIGIIFGMLQGILFISGLRNKEKVIAGAMIGAGVTASLILINLLVDVGALPQKVLGVIIGIVFAAGVGSTLKREEQPRSDQ